MRINEANWTPCYLNPSFEELKELADSKWDTCRILVNDKNDDMVIASGYGNTHNSITLLYKVYLGGTRAVDNYGNPIVKLRWSLMPSTDTYILYHVNGIALMNLEDVSGSQKARFERWPLSQKNLEILTDLIQLSNLSK